VSELFLFGSFTAGLLVSGTLAPIAGRLIDARGGRLVLSLGSGAGFLAMALLAVAPNPLVLVAGWLVAGAAMSSCLCDQAFATLSQHAGDRYRRAVTALTLFGLTRNNAVAALVVVALAAAGCYAMAVHPDGARKAA
jgi:MFS family permease